MKTVLTVCATLVGLVVAASLAVIAFPLSHYSTSDSGPAAASRDVAAVASSTDLAATATVAFAWSGSRAVSATLAGSVLTRVWARPGVRTRCDAPVIDVDGESVRALCGATPLWRTVRAGMTGSDVDEVVAFLRTGGWLDGEFSSDALTDAIKSWQQASGMSKTGELAPDELVWLGRRALTPSSVPVKVGQPVTPDMQILSTRPHLVRAAVSPHPSSKAAWVFNIAGLPQTVAVAPDGSITDLTAFGALIRAVAQPGRPLPSSEQGELHLAEPIQALAVPASALVPGPRSATCVVVDSSPTRTVARVSVEAATSSTVLVSGDLRPGQRVLTAPPPATRCP